MAPNDPQEWHPSPEEVAEALASQGKIPYGTDDRSRLEALVLTLVPDLVRALEERMAGLVQLPRPDKGGECWWYDTVRREWVTPCSQLQVPPA